MDSSGLDLQLIQVTNDETLDSHSNIITKLNLEQRLPGGRKTCEELLHTVGLKLEHDPDARQKDKVCHQFVLQGQCLVLGDSGVGKTSLVKSLTGKPFDNMEPKTHGIEQTLVNQKWENLDMKDLIFGNLDPFVEENFTQLFLYGKNGEIIFQEGMLTKSSWPSFLTLPSLIYSCLLYRLWNPSTWRDTAIWLGFFVFLLFVKTHFSEYVVLCVLGFFLLVVSVGDLVYRFFMASMFPCITFNPRGLIMGIFMSVMVQNIIVGFLHGTFLQISILIQFFLFILTVTILAYFAFMVWRNNKTFAIDTECLHPGQLVVKTQQPIQIIFFFRFMISVVAMFFVRPIVLVILFCFNYTDLTPDLVTNVFMYVVFFSFKTLPQICKSLPGWRLQKTLILGGISFLWLGGLLLSPSMYFTLGYLVLLGDNLYTEHFCLTSVLTTTDHEQEGSNMFTAIIMDKAVMKTKLLKIALSRKWSSLKLKIFDFAGDRKYHAYHNMFLRRDAIYIIVFSLAEFAENSLRDMNKGIKRLHLWFESVCSHVPPRTPILLVGTHRENMQKTLLESINDHLKNTIWNLFCDELIVNDVDELIFFPIENSNGPNDIGIQTLQIAIMAVVEELEGTIGRKIPLSWIRIQDGLISMRDKKMANVCVTFEEFPHIFDNFVCTNWCEDTLKYFHKQGLIMYMDKGPKTVLLNPGVMVDIIIQLVKEQPARIPQRGFRHDWKLLCQKGMLTERLLESILSKVAQGDRTAIKAFLEEFDFICSLTYKGAQIKVEDCKPTYFVPALLPYAAKDERALLWKERATDKKFFVFFNKLLPEPLFHCLLSRAHKNSKVEFWHSQPVLFRDVGKFWMSPRQPYRLKLMKDMKMIEVLISSRLGHFSIFCYLPW